MKQPRTILPTRLRADDGHSLVEAVVATALLITVLLPVSSTAIYLLTVKKNEPHLVALTLGEQVMEATLHRRAYTPETFHFEGERWTVQRSVAQDGNQVTIRVRVFRWGRPRPLVELMTVRLLA